MNNLDPSFSSYTDNLTIQERNALQDLQNNRDIVIKKADKGGSWVVMDTDFYRDKLIMEGHLNTEAYTPVNDDCDVKVISKLKQHVKKYEECLTNKERDYLTNFDWESSNFYALPKVHKCSEIANKVNETMSDYIELPPPPDLKGRPIVAGCNSPTQRLSGMIEKLLKPIVPFVKTYDFHFI